MAQRPLQTAAWVALLLVIGLPGWVSVNSFDAPMLDDADLAQVAAQIRAESDAYTHLRRAVLTLPWSLEEQAAFREAAADKARERLPELDANLTELAVGLAAPRLELPRFDVDADRWLFPGLLTLAHGLTLRAHMRQAAGDRDGALDDVFAILRLGHQLEGADEGVLTSAMLSLALKKTGLRIFRELAEGHASSAAEARHTTDRLAEFAVDPAHWQRMWAAEYRWARGMLQSATEPERDARLTPIWLGSLLPGSYLYQPNRTLGLVAERFRSAQRGSDQPCSKLGDGAADRVQAWELVRPNPVGRVIVGLSTFDFTPFFEHRCAVNVELAATRTLLALKAYHSATGALPQRLDALVPDYLDALPIDDFDGRPLRYSRSEGRIYSVGSGALPNPDHKVGELSFAISL